MRVGLSLPSLSSLLSANCPTALSKAAANGATDKPAHAPIQGTGTRPAVLPAAPKAVRRSRGSGFSKVALVSLGAAACLRGAAAAVDKHAVVPRLASFIGTPPPPTLERWNSTGPTMDDVEQGTVDDCWLLAVLAAMAQSRPQLLEQNLVAADSSNQSYNVTLYTPAGHQVNYMVPSVPSFSVYSPNNSQSLAAAPSFGDDIPHNWVPAYELAFISYATLNPGSLLTSDGYLDDGHSEVAFQIAANITAQNDPIQGTASGQLWFDASISNCNRMVVAYTPQAPNNATYFDNMLVGNHAYTVLGTAQEMESASITLRNPWGPYSPNVVNATNGNDGVFTMDWNTFKQYFGGFVYENVPC